jgi:hypothetical protein
MSKVKEAVSKEKTKEGLPKEAFAIVGDPDDPETWKLPHHTKAIFRYLRSGGASPRLVCRLPLLPSVLEDIGGRGYRHQGRISSELPGIWPDTMRRQGSRFPIPWAP